MIVVDSHKKRNRQAEAERNMRSIVEKMRSEQQESLPVDDLEEEEVPPISHERTPTRRVFGNMTGAGISDDDEDDEEDEMDEAHAAQVILQSDMSDDGELPPGAGISDDDEDDEEDEMDEAHAAQVILQSDMSDDGELPPHNIDSLPDKGEVSSGDDF